MVASHVQAELGEVTGWIEREPGPRIGLKSRRQNIVVDATRSQMIDKHELQRIRDFYLGRLTITLDNP